jgi:hypothetical protein
MTAKNVPITFVWMSLVQDHDWPERSTEKKIPSRVQIVAVAFVLMRHADADGQNVYPAVGTVAELAGVGLATVRNVYGVMRGEGFLRPDGNGRHRTLKYRLIYPSLSSQIDPAGSISTTKSRQTTNRTESPTDDDSSPKGDIVAPTANTERSVSIPKVKVDESVLERNRLEFLRPFFERGERVSYPETREMTQEFKDQGFWDEWDDFTGTPVFSDFQHFLSKTIISCSYTDVIEVMSGESTDENQISDFYLDSVFKNMAFAFENTLEMFIETYCLWRSEKESGWMLDWKHGKSPSMNAIGWDLDFGYKPPESSNGSMELMSFSYLVGVVRDLLKKIFDSRDRVMAIRANAGSVSVSATNTGSDRMIVEKIVETVSEKVEVKGLERW